MAHLQDAMTFAGEGNQLVRLLQCGGDGLLHQDIDSSFENGGGDVKVRRSGDTDTGRVDAEAGVSSGEALLHAGIDRDRAFGVQGCGTNGVGVDHGGEGNRRSGVLQFAQDADMVLAEGAGAEDCDVQERAVTGWAGV